MARRWHPPDDDLAPITTSWLAVDEWLAGLPFDMSPLARDITWSPVFTEQGFRPGRAGLDREWRWGGWVSWLGGPALLPLDEWPRRPDGRPLAHVTSLSLHDAWAAAEEEGKAAWPGHREGLPTEGYLEVFHDLVDTYGWEPGDRDAGGWLVRWVPQPQRPGFAEPPADLDTPTDACQAGMLLPGWSSRPSGDFRADRGQNAAATLVAEEFQRAWAYQRTRSRSAPPTPVTHVYGHSQNSTAPALRILREALPVQDGDDHRLVLDIESWTHLSGWFGDAASLEVWMRDSDLAARRFDRAWCITRTD
ncbi:MULTISPECIES: YwqG family protein [unclassified Geodermatophilus]